jgi:hypothetical protein
MNKKSSNSNKFIKRVAFTLKAVGTIMLGTIKPVTAVVEPDGTTTFRTRFKGVMSDNGHFENWAMLSKDFYCVIKNL